MSQPLDPFSSALPAEILLTQAPLSRVIAQVVFPSVLSLADQNFVAPFQEKIREIYPIFRPEISQGVVFSATGLANVQNQTLWRFSDIDDKWRITLTLNFLSLETTAYTDRKDFLERFKVIVAALESTIPLKLCDRLGIRYINRIIGEPLKSINKMIQPAMLGINNTAVSKYIEVGISEAHFNFDASKLLARWGLIPANSTPDPTAIEPISEPSWILDFDISTVGVRPFDTNTLLAEAEKFSGKVYSFFRWAVTKDFISQYEK